MKYWMFISFLIALFLIGCSGSETIDPEETPVEDTSFVNFELDTSAMSDDEIIQDLDPPPPSSYSSRKLKGYEREGDNPEEFVRAVTWDIIHMCYNESFKKAKIDISKQELEGDRYTIKFSVTWSDPWVAGYKIYGTLKVNQDGSDAVFKITKKNLEAESLEYTNGGNRKSKKWNQI